MTKETEIYKWSNPEQVKRNAKAYFNQQVPIYLSTRKDKKYMIQDTNGKWIHFGQMGYEDFTKHKDIARRQDYLKRSMGIKGNWKQNPFSPNNLSIHLLW